MRCLSFLLQVIGTEAFRQQLSEGICPVIVRAGGQKDPERIRIAELHHHLAANAAGRGMDQRLPFRSGHNGDTAEAALPFADRFEKRGALGTVAGSIGGVFNIAAAIDRAAGSLQRGAHLKVGIRRISIFAGFDGLQDQFLVTHAAHLLLGFDIGLAVGRGGAGFAHEQHQHHHRGDIRDHGDQLRGNGRRTAQHHAEAGTHTEQQAGPHGALGFELAEDDGGDGDEAVAHHRRGAELVHGRHGDGGAAQARQESGDDHGGIADADDVDTQGVTGLGMFTGSPEPQSEAGLVEDEPH